jgi:hypothetical protein
LAADERLKGVGGLNKWRIQRSKLDPAAEFQRFADVNAIKFGGRRSFMPLATGELQNGEITMQYILLCCFDESAWDKLPDAQKDKINYGDWVQSLVKSGHFCGGVKLHPTSSAKTVYVKNGKTVLSDGPFAETKEQLGGYHLIDCTDLNEAISIAARIPTLPVGGMVEVRCIAELER